MALGNILKNAFDWIGGGVKSLGGEIGKGFSGLNNFIMGGMTNGGAGATSFFEGLLGQGTEWDKKNFDAQQAWAQKQFDRDQLWRNQDIEREQQIREQNHQWESPAYKAQQLKDAGLHPALAAEGNFGGGGGAPMPMNLSGNRSPATVNAQDRGNPLEMVSLLSQVANDKAYRSLMGEQARGLSIENNFEEALYDEKVRDAKAELSQNALRRSAEKMNMSVDEINTRFARLMELPENFDIRSVADFSFLWNKNYDKGSVQDEIRKTMLSANSIDTIIDKISSVFHASANFNRSNNQSRNVNQTTSTSDVTIRRNK